MEIKPEQLQSALEEVQKLARELGALIMQATRGRDAKNRLKAVRVACRRLALPRPPKPSLVDLRHHDREIQEEAIRELKRWERDRNHRKAARAKLREAGGVYGIQ